MPYAIHLRAVCLALLALALVGGIANAQTPALDAERGRELASRVCINCHVVEPGAEVAQGQIAPSFRTISQQPGQTPERIAGRIIVPHPAMPTISLTMKEIRDIVTYIMTLENFE